MPYQPSTYGITATVEEAVAAITNDQYTFALNTFPFTGNSVWEDRVTDAHRISAKYSDLSSEIKPYYPTDAMSAGQTVVKMGGLDVKTLIAEKAAKYKAEVLNREYSVLDGLGKDELEKSLKYVNDMANQHAYTEYIIDIITKNKYAMDKLGVTGREELEEKVRTDYQSNLPANLNLETSNTFLRKSYNILDKDVEGIIRLLKDNNLEIQKDGSIKDKNFDKIYQTIGIDRGGTSWKSLYTD